MYAPGYHPGLAEPDEALIAEAVALAKRCDRAVVFAGLPDEMESEAFDRADMRMPEAHVRLIEAVAAANPNTAVVLMIGSPVEMDWEARVPAILNAYLGGQATGGAIADLLFGRANPCGKLPESFPMRLEHTPAYLNYADRDRAEYREGVFVGYRYYDTKMLPVRYPFGHGLSYTAFNYSDIETDRQDITDRETLTVSLTVRNTGRVAGKEAVQLYVRDGHTRIERPDKELKAFAKVSLQPGESERITFQLDRRAFAYYDETLHDWNVEEGEFEILVGASSRDIRLVAKVFVRVIDPRLPKITPYTIVADILRSPAREALMMEMLKRWAPDISDQLNNPRPSECATVEALRAIFLNMPLHALKLSEAGENEEAVMQEYIGRMNALNG
jgi:beta-glucosidase